MAGKAVNVCGPAAPIVYGTAVAPAWNNVWPDSETLSASRCPATRLLKRSAMRPAQPDFEGTLPFSECH